MTEPKRRFFSNMGPILVEPEYFNSVALIIIVLLAVCWTAANTLQSKSFGEYCQQSYDDASVPVMTTPRSTRSQKSLDPRAVVSGEIEHEHGSGHTHTHHHDEHGDSRWSFSVGHRLPKVKDDGHGHHGHSHGLGDHTTATGKHRKKLVIVLCITASVFLIQVVGAMISNSLALLADAGHMLTDATGVFIALIASVIATRPASAKRTFGYQRIEVLAALINGIAIAVIAVLIFVEAIKRLGSEVEVAAGPMLIAAVLGALANLISLLILQSGQKESLNVRGAYLEVLGDLLGSVAVIIAGVIIWFTGWMLADQIASIAIALLILPRAWSLLKDVVHVLMEATPKDMDLEETRAHLLSVPGVVDVHDMHAWTITSGVPVFSAHVVVDDEAFESSSPEPILDELLACLGEHFDTDHSTLQIEPVNHLSHERKVHA